MVSIEAIRKHNASLKKLGPGLVAVFVGGTSGIGLSTAREFVRSTVSPRLYLIGRNEAQASQIIQELHSLNGEAKVDFIQSDVSQLRNVDAACDEIKGREEKINLLFMTPGILTTKGRTETPEGLDRKLSLHYYSRMRFIHNLLPQLSAAAGTAEGDSSSNITPLSRAVSVLSPGGEGKLHLDDLSLKHNYSLGNAATYAITMTSLSLMELAAAHPTTAFVHSMPGGVDTNILRDFNPVVRGLVWGLGKVLTSLPVSIPAIVPIDQSGERHVYAATSELFAPRSCGTEGAGQPQGVREGVPVGADGEPGSGAYRLNWDSELQTKKNPLLKEYAADGVADKVWKHTLEVFDSICSSPEGKY